MQGMVAYYYDHIDTDNAVELNQCLFNHVGVDVTVRGKCRNIKTCEDCRKTNIIKVYNIYHTNCRKPWLFQATVSPNGKKPGGERGSALNTNNVNVDHCLDMSRAWHTLRSDLETKLYNLTKDDTVHSGAVGEYQTNVFQGHCKDDGSSHYINIAGPPQTMTRIKDQYK